MRWILVLMVAGCMEAPIDDFVPMEGLTPVPVSERVEVNPGNLLLLRRQCVGQVPQLRPEAAQRLCACVVNTGRVYISKRAAAEEARAIDSLTEEQIAARNGIGIRIQKACYKRMM